MNDQQYRARHLTWIILSFLFFHPLLAQESEESSTPTQKKIILRSMISQGGLKKNNTPYRVNVWNNPISNSVYSSSKTLLQVAKKDTPTLVKTCKKALQTLKASPKEAKAITKAIPGATSDTLKELSIINKVSTGSSFFGSVAGKDPVGAGESLLNGAGSGYAAAVGAKGGAVIGSAILPGVGTFVGGCIGRIALQ